MAKKDTQIQIPHELVTKLEKIIKKAGFDSVQEYALFVLEQTISSEEFDGEKYEKDEEENVKERLKELGYL